VRYSLSTIRGGKVLLAETGDNTFTTLLADWRGYEAVTVDDSVLGTTTVYPKLDAPSAADALAFAHGCFEAARFEGWQEAINEGNIERIRDLWERRMAFGVAMVQETANVVHH
jgi:hypothetical protein